MTTCLICAELKEQLRKHKITSDVYREKMVVHNDEELKKIQNERIPAESRQ